MSTATVVAAPDTPNPVRHNRIDATVAGILTSELGVVGVVIGAIGPVAMTDTIVPDFPLVNKSFNLSYAGNDL
ncbi:hypothetical protein [Nocardia sp. NPDC004604]|uniref:hypothetical protein n=1 Tax=Nocardia sp. NPDC004604 TaxID=3157013 RepID=UPI0033B04577